MQHESSEPDPDPTRAGPGNLSAKSTEVGLGELDRRLAFLQLGSAEAERLASALPGIRRHLDDFVAEFYRHLLAFDETSRFLRDDERIEYLKQAQRRHFETLLECDWNQEFLDDRRRVGKVHADEGIEPKLFLGAHNQYVQFCMRQMLGEAPSADEVESMSALLKVVFLDIGLTLDAYFQQSTRRLRQALDMYWQANNELKRFAQLTSHDLKTPLATVANLCDEALDEFGDEMPAEAAGLVRAARERAYRMGTLIEELLATSVVDHCAEDEVSLRDVLSDALARVRAESSDKQVSVEMPDELPRVWGNAVRLREAFYNLLSNAAKFSDSDEGNVRIRIGLSLDDSYCVTSVADNGSGIPANELDRIFVPFRRLPQHRRHPGSGLGLYFTKQLVESLGGRVWVESTLGEGSVFHVRLPRVHPSDAMP